jgi:regulator of replication initiation timing
VTAPAASSLELAELKAKLDDLAARTAAASETLTRLESSAVRVDALEAMRERVDGLVGVMRHEVSQRIDPAARSIADLKNAFEASVERQTEAVTELRHATSREIATAFETRDAASTNAATDKLREEMTEKIARILADERESLDARRKEDLAALKGDIERLEATVGEKVREVGALRNDLESATNGLRLEFTSLLAKTAEEATAGREGFARELESMRNGMDGFAGGEREARSALEGKISAFEAALERLRSESDAAHTRAHERLFAAEERARKLAEAVRKAFEGL